MEARGRLPPSEKNYICENFMGDLKMSKVWFGFAIAFAAVFMACEDENTVNSPVGGISSVSEELTSSSGTSEESSNSENVDSSESESIESSDSEDIDSSDSDDEGPKSGVLTDPRDGQEYKTIVIGGQEWMAENLNYAYTAGTEGDGLESSSVCPGKENSDELDDSNCAIYGRLYVWSAVMDSAGVIEGNMSSQCGNGNDCAPPSPFRGICPEGWHVPTKKEWEKLFEAVGGESVAGKVLKSTSGWYSSSTPGTDEFGFTVLPVGYWFSSTGVFSSRKKSASFWIAADEDEELAFRAYFDLSYNNASVTSVSKEYGFSVRCVKD